MEVDAAVLLRNYDQLYWLLFTVLEQQLAADGEPPARGEVGARLR